MASPRMKHLALWDESIVRSSAMQSLWEGFVDGRWSVRWFDFKLAEVCAYRRGIDDLIQARILKKRISGSKSKGDRVFRPSDASNGAFSVESLLSNTDQDLDKSNLIPAVTDPVSEREALEFFGRVFRLTEREKYIVMRYAQNFTMKDIGGELGISESLVSVYLRKITAKALKHRERLCLTKS